MKYLLAHFLVLDGFDQLLSFLHCAVHCISSVRLIILITTSKEFFFETLIIKPGAAGCQAQILLLGYAAHLNDPICFGALTLTRVLGKAGMFNKHTSGPNCPWFDSQHSTKYIERKFDFAKTNQRHCWQMLDNIGRTHLVQDCQSSKTTRRSSKPSKSVNLLVSLNLTYKDK